MSLYLYDFILSPHRQPLDHYRKINVGNIQNKSSFEKYLLMSAILKIFGEKKTNILKM